MKELKHFSIKGEELGLIKIDPKEVICERWFSGNPDLLKLSIRQVGDVWVNLKEWRGEDEQEKEQA